MCMVIEIWRAHVSQLLNIVKESFLNNKRYKMFLNRGGLFHIHSYLYCREEYIISTSVYFLYA
jgi:hypothetical protein